MNIEDLPEGKVWLVMTNFYRHESAFITTELLWIHWESTDIVHMSATTNPPVGWECCDTPDGRCVIIKLLPEVASLPASKRPRNLETKKPQITMSDEPAKKLPPKKAAPPKASAKSAAAVKAPKGASSAATEKPAAKANPSKDFRTAIKELDTAHTIKAAVKAGALPEDPTAREKAYVEFIEEAKSKDYQWLVHRFKKWVADRLKS